MVRNQDDELSFRIRKQGGRILQDASIRVKYFVRDSFGKLLKQFSQYGYWKVPVIRKHPKQASLRHLFPALFVTCLVFLSILSPFYFLARIILALLASAYLGSLALSAYKIVLGTKENMLFPGIVLALICMHFGYGIGFILGAFRMMAGPLPTDHYFEQLSR